MTTPTSTPAVTVPGCPHVPQCPAADAVDHDAARVVGYDHSLAASVLCNRVVIWTDGAELVPDASPAGCHTEDPHGSPAPHCTNPDHAHCCAEDAWAAVDAAGRALLAETKEAA